MNEEPNLAKGLWKPPKFDAPIVQPEKTPWERFRQFFSPQVNAAMVGWLLLAISSYSCHSKYQTIHDQEQTISNQKADINRLTTENTGYKTQLGTYTSIPARTPKLIDDLENLLAHDPTNQQLLASIKTELGIISDGFQATVPRFALYWETNVVPPDSIAYDLKGARELPIKVKNISKVTANELEVSVGTLPPLDPTNVIAPLWRQGGGVADEQGNTIGTLWTWTANQKLSGGGNFYTVDSFRLSTNCTLPQVVLKLQVYSLGSLVQKYTVVLVLKH